MSTNFVVLEGNIGVGKTSLSKKMAEDYCARLVLERFSDNPFLPLFYENQDRYAFQVELSFLADRFNQLKEQLTSPGLFSNFILSDYHITKSLIFAQVTLSDQEYKLFRQMFDIMFSQIPKPDLYVYLNSSTNRLLRNIKQRGRDYETNIKTDYLERVQKSYLNYFKQSGLPVLILDLPDEFDFIRNEEHYKIIKKYIFAVEPYKKGVTHAVIEI